MDWLKKKKKKKKKRLVRGARLLEDLIECCDGKSNPIRFFSADQIIKATNNFSESNRVTGLDYHCYSGKIDNHPMVFFMKTNYGYELKDYCRDTVISSMASGHKHFMKLLGCCLELNHPVIAYNFINAYKLDLKTVVSWKRRIKIAEDIATVLAYLHSAFSRPFVYRILCLQNIFLDEQGVARLWNFSDCISIPQGETSVKVDRVMGTYDFVDDKYWSTGTVSEKTDVFAIGILMQKLLTGEERFRELCKEHQEESEMDVSRRIVVRWLSKSTEERRMDEMVDPMMLEKMDQVGEEAFCQVKAFLVLSLRCIGLKGEVPKMVEVAKELKKIQKIS